MKLKTFFTVVAVVAVVFAIGLLFAPGLMDSAYGTSGTPGEVLTDRMFGSALLAFGVLYWLARDFTGAEARAVILAGLVGEVVLFIVSLNGMLDGVMDATGWSLVVISLLFTLGFGYFRFVARPA